MKRLSMILLLAAITATSSAAEASKFDSPQAVFAAAQTANAKGNWLAVVKTLTPGARDELAFIATASSVMVVKEPKLSGAGEEKTKTLVLSLKKTYKKHGLSVEMFERTEKKIQQKQLDDFGKIVDLVLAPVKDRDRYLADLLTVMNTVEEMSAIPFAASARLVDVKIMGNTAVGIVVKKIVAAKKDPREKDLKELGPKDKDDEQDAEPTEERKPLKFKKLDGSWRIHMELFTTDPEAGQKKRESDSEKR